MTQNQTAPTPRSATDLIASVPDANRRADSVQLLELMRNVTGAEPVVWGSSIIGFGTHHYSYENGRKGDTVAVGFAPRAKAIVLYGIDNDQILGLAESLGSYTTGKGCLYVKRLSDIKLDVLEPMIKRAFTARQTRMG